MKKEKSSKYYEALDKAFQKLADKSVEEFNTLLQSHSNSDVTNLLIGYAYSNTLETAEAKVSSSFILEPSCVGLLPISYESQSLDLGMPMISTPAVNTSSSTTPEEPTWNLLLAA